MLFQIGLTEDYYLFADPQRVASVVDQVCGALKTRKANSEEGSELHQGSFGNRVIGRICLRAFQCGNRVISEIRLSSNLNSRRSSLGIE